MVVGRFPLSAPSHLASGSFAVLSFDLFAGRVAANCHLYQGAYACYLCCVKCVICLGHCHFAAKNASLCNCFLCRPKGLPSVRLCEKFLALKTSSVLFFGPINMATFSAVSCLVFGGKPFRLDNLRDLSVLWIIHFWGHKLCLPNWFFALSVTSYIVRVIHVILVTLCFLNCLVWSKKFTFSIYSIY